ncbi:MAG: 5-(carboxyamino)imidazole ribonucleotide synthase [Pseudomonadota bacterium]
MILPPATLGMLGGGQLGRMFTIAARTMGYRVVVLEPDVHSPAGDIADEHVIAVYEDTAALDNLARDCSAITTEFENAPAGSLSALENRCIVRPAGDSVAIAQDRIREKTFLRGNGFPVGPFAVIDSGNPLPGAARDLHFPALLKTARFGYDGKGQAKVFDLAEAQSIHAQWKHVDCVLEEFLPLKCEVSVVLARGADGETCPFPIAENQHRNGILDVSIVPARVSSSVTERAKTLAMQLAEKLNYVGILAVEFFVLDDDTLLINEIAPRPHNSGHYTIDACRTSQFEQQVRTLCGLPLGDPSLHSPVVMVNLLGDVWANGEPDWDTVLRHPRAKLHLYGKRDARPGRKMGHFTVMGDTIEAALANAIQIKQDLGIP